jgi:hypothetical protein
MLLDNAAEDVFSIRMALTNTGLPRSLRVILAAWRHARRVRHAPVIMAIASATSSRCKTCRSEAQ